MRLRVKKHSSVPATLSFSWIIIAFCLAGVGYSQGVEGTSYPTRPINFIIPLPPGEASEISIRLLLSSAEKHLGQSIVPINRPGAGLTIGISEIARAKPDGYTIGFSAFGPMLVTPLLQKVAYDPVADFVQIMQFSLSNPGLVVRADSPYKSVKDLINQARRGPKKLTFGAIAVGLNPTIMQKIAKKEGVEFNHMPYAGVVQAEMALLGGHIDMASGDFSSSLLDAGKTRLLAIYREERADEYPQVPILKELGYDIPCRLYFGAQAPKGVPDAMIKRLEEAFTKAIKEPGFIKGMKELRYPIVYRNSKELNEFVARGFQTYKEFFK